MLPEADMRLFAEKVQPMFERQGWTYWNDTQPPTVEQIYAVLRSNYLALEKLPKDYLYVSSGRIRVEWYEDRIIWTLEIPSEIAY